MKKNPQLALVYNECRVDSSCPFNILYLSDIMMQDNKNN